MPIRDIFEAQGKLGEYRLLRLAHTLHLYDLTVPITVVRQMPTLPQAGSLQMTQGNPIRQLLDPKLILPRIKELFQNRAALQRALEQEIEEANTDTRRRRSPQRHECTGHARLLPPGKRASASARALAAHEGINLAPNETYVSKHKRGRGQTLVGPHEAVRR
jgi:hypothetical protein